MQHFPIYYMAAYQRNISDPENWIISTTSDILLLSKTAQLNSLQIEKKKEREKKKRIKLFC